MKPVFRIQRYSVHDGPGIRTTLFFQGCPLRCAWCHNPESQARGPRLDSDAVASETRALMAEIQKDILFYDESDGGVTFSGGEALGQPELLMALLTACREQEIHTCLDTSGFGPASVLRGAARLADLVLYDLKLMDDAAHRKYTGVPLAPVLDHLKALSADPETEVWLRFPLIPGITDGPENIQALLTFAREETRFRRIHILPFHNTAQGKYDQLDKTYDLDQLAPPEDAAVEAVRHQFETAGFSAHIGG